MFDNIQVTRPSSLDILPVCKAPVVDSNGTTKEMIVGLFVNLKTLAWDEAVSEMKPPLTIDLANATTLGPGNVDVAIGIPFEPSVRAIAHLPNNSIKLHHSIQAIIDFTHIFKREVCHRQCSPCAQSLSSEQDVYYNLRSKLATHRDCEGERPAPDPNNPCLPGYLVEVGSKLYCFCMVKVIEE